MEEDGAIACLAYSPDGKLIAIGKFSDDPGVNEVRLSDSLTGKVVRTIVVDNRVDHSGRRDTYVTGGGGVPMSFVLGPFFGVSDVAFSGSGEELACASLDGTTRIWGVTSGRELATLRGRAGLGGSVAFSPDGKRIATGNSDGTASVWDVAESGGLAAAQDSVAGSAPRLVPIANACWSPQVPRWPPSALTTRKAMDCSVSSIQAQVSPRFARFQRGSR